MAISKVILNGTTLMDVTSDTVDASNLLSGYYATGADGVRFSGSYVVPTGTINITQSGNTDVTHYATASVAAGSAATPATSITTNPSITVSSSGVITASVNTSQSVTPTVSSGFVTSGTAGTVTVSGSNTKTLTTKGAQTYTPTTSNQTISSGQYLTGIQTIKGDANLIASNIKSGVTIFNVAGTYGGGGGSTVTVYVDTAPLNRIEAVPSNATVTGSMSVTLPSDSMFVISCWDEAVGNGCTVTELCRVSTQYDTYYYYAVFPGNSDGEVVW